MAFAEVYTRASTYIQYKNFAHCLGAKRGRSFAEIAKLMGLPFADSKTRNWFSYLSKALGNITSRLMAEEQAEMQQELEHRKKHGNPDHVKRK